MEILDLYEVFCNLKREKKLSSAKINIINGKIRKLRDLCSHQVIIHSERDDNYRIYSDNRCAICGKPFYGESLPNDSYIIDLSDCQNDDFSKYGEARDIFFYNYKKNNDVDASVTLTQNYEKIMKTKRKSK